MSRPIDADEFIRKICNICNAYYEDEPNEPCRPEDCFAMRAIKDTPTLIPQNEPLTIEELRKMDGEPVYIISEFYHISEWNIPNGIGEIVIAYDVPCAGMKSVIPSVKFIDGKELSVDKYGSDWVAYRRPLEEVEDTNG